MQFCHVFLYPTNRGQSRCSLNYGCGPIFKTLICIVVSIIYYGVFPAILRVDVGAELDETGGDVDPAVERRHVERRAVVVVSGLDERGILLEELPHSCGVVLVRVPEYQRRATHSLLLLLLLTAVAAATTRTHRFSSSNLNPNRRTVRFIQASVTSSSSSAFYYNLVLVGVGPLPQRYL